MGCVFKPFLLPHPPALGLGGATFCWRLFCFCHSVSFVTTVHWVVSVTPIFFFEALLQLAKLSPLNSRPVGQDLFSWAVFLLTTFSDCFKKQQSEFIRISLNIATSHDVFFSRIVLKKFCIRPYLCSSVRAHHTVHVHVAYV